MKKITITVSETTADRIKQIQDYRVVIRNDFIDLVIIKLLREERQARLGNKEKSNRDFYQNALEVLKNLGINPLGLNVAFQHYLTINEIKVSFKDTKLGNIEINTYLFDGNRNFKKEFEKQVEKLLQKFKSKDN